MGCGLHSRKTSIIQSRFNENIITSSPNKEYKNIENTINKNTDFKDLKIFDKYENLSILEDDNKELNNNNAFYSNFINNIYFEDKTIFIKNIKTNKSIIEYIRLIINNNITNTKNLYMQNVLNNINEDVFVYLSKILVNRISSLYIENTNQCIIDNDNNYISLLIENNSNILSSILLNKIESNNKTSFISIDEGIKKCTNLTELKLYKYELSQNFLSSLKNILNIQNLHLVECNIENYYSIIIEYILNLKFLKELNLSKNNLKSCHMCYLFDFNLSYLEKINLESCELNDNNLLELKDKLISTSNNLNISEVNFNNNYLSFNSIEYINNIIIYMPKLKILNITNNDLSNEYVKAHLIEEGLNKIII